MIDVKVLDVNDRGQIKLSHRAVIEANEHPSITKKSAVWWLV